MFVARGSQWAASLISCKIGLMATSSRLLPLFAALSLAGGCAPLPIDRVVRLSAIPESMPDPFLPSRLPGGYDEAMRDTDVLGPYRQARMRYRLLMYVEQTYGSVRLTESQLSEFARGNGFACELPKTAGEPRHCVHDRSVPFRAAFPAPIHRRVEIVLVTRRNSDGSYNMTDVRSRLVE